MNNRLYAKRFPSTATLTEMQDWRAAKRTDVLREALQRAETEPEPEPETFAADVVTYLKTVTSMTTYTERQQHMALWSRLFGDRTRDSIKAPEIRAVLEGWRASGWTQTLRATGVSRVRPLSESTCNKRRTALMHFFTVMNGKSGSNPARDVPKYREPEPEPRGYPYQVITAILDRMRPTKTRARLKVITWTGLSPRSLQRVKPEDVDAANHRLFRRRRQKGHGTRGQSIPILPQAVKAFAELAEHAGFGVFDAHALGRRWRHAVALFTAHMREQDPAFTLPSFTVKDLRHSFGTRAYEVTGDLRAVAELLDHSTLDLTKRYTLKAVDARLVDAVRLLANSHRARRKVTGGVTTKPGTTRKTTKTRRRP